MVCTTPSRVLPGVPFGFNLLMHECVCAVVCTPSELVSLWLLSATAGAGGRASGNPLRAAMQSAGPGM